MASSGFRRSGSWHCCSPCVGGEPVPRCRPRSAPSSRAGSTWPASRWPCPRATGRWWRGAAPASPQMDRRRLWGHRDRDPVPAGASARRRLRRRQPQRRADRGGLGHRQRMPGRGRRAAADRQLRRRGCAHFLRLRRRGAQCRACRFAERLEDAASYGKARELVPAAAMVDGRLPPERPQRCPRRPLPLQPGCAGPSGQRRSDDLGLVDWLESMREPVRIGFYNGLAGLAPMPMPWTAAAGGPSPV